MSCLEVSCPECGKVHIIEVQYCDETNNTFTAMFGALLGGINHYSFKGMQLCECGFMVNVCMTVSAMKGGISTCA